MDCGLCVSRWIQAFCSKLRNCSALDTATHTLANKIEARQKVLAIEIVCGGWSIAAQMLMYLYVLTLRYKNVEEKNSLLNFQIKFCDRTKIQVSEMKAGRKWQR